MKFNRGILQDNFSIVGECYIIFSLYGTWCHVRRLLMKTVIFMNTRCKKPGKLKCYVVIVYSVHNQSSNCSTGDDGSGDEPQQGILVKESESHYSLWCSGRVNCEGLLVELKVSENDSINNTFNTHWF